MNCYGVTRLRTCQRGINSFCCRKEIDNKVTRQMLSQLSHRHLNSLTITGYFIRSLPSHTLKTDKYSVR